MKPDIQITLKVSITQNRAKRALSEELIRDLL